MPRLLNISSPDNPQIKLVRQLLTSGKARHDNGSAVLEGLHLCQSAMQAGVLAQLTLVAQSAQLEPSILALTHHVDRVLVIEDKLFRDLSQLEQGLSLLQVVALPSSQPPTTFEGDALFLDGVQDPGNVGTLIRTSAAAGLSQVFLSADCADPWSPKVLRSAMGGHFALKIVTGMSIDALLQTAPPLVIATSLQATQSVYDLPLNANTLWCFGNEGQGLRASTLQALSAYGQKNKMYQSVLIPQVAAVESLNVAAAAAICLFEQRRQRRV
jgi:RNA methyltransferase, TrmH family